MDLVAYFQQEMPVFQHNININYVSQRHSQDTVMRHELRRGNSRQSQSRQDTQVSRLSQDRDTINHVSKQCRVKIRVSILHHWRQPRLTLSQ